MIQQVYTETQSHPKSTAMKPHSTGSGWISKDWRWSRGQFFITTEGARFSRSLGYPWFFLGEMIPSHGRTIQVNVKYSNLPRIFWGIPKWPNSSGDWYVMTVMIYHWFRMTSYDWDILGAHICNGLWIPVEKTRSSETRDEGGREKLATVVSRKYPQPPFEKAIPSGNLT